jgi:chemotaxis protein MotB
MAAAPNNHDQHGEHDDHEEHRSHHHEEHEGGHDEPWLVSYADMMTLLFGFFVIMYSFASAKNADQEEWFKMKKELATYFGGEYVNPVEGVGGQLKKAIEASNLNGEVDVKLTGDALEVIMQSKTVFESGQADIIETQRPLISKLLDILIEKKLDGYSIRLEGHTDDNPIKTEKFRSNWDLSGARANTVAMMLQEKGFEPQALSVRSFGEFKPLLPNRNEAGEPIPENQAKNRRIVIKLVNDRAD